MSPVQEAATYQNLIFAREGPIAVVTLNRPERRNALSLALMQELVRCLDEIGRDREIRAVILAAAGKVFCSGHDLSEMTGRNINEYRNYEPHGGQLYKTNRALEYEGTTYADGDTIPFNNGGGTAYTNDYLMEIFFNAGMVDPA